MKRQAWPYGICPVRELLPQAFDELLRQVTLESPERGLMMLRVRTSPPQHLRVHDPVQ